jgi:hypothetical protein
MSRGTQITIFAHQLLCSNNETLLDKQLLVLYFAIGLGIQFQQVVKLLQSGFFSANISALTHHI